MAQEDKFKREIDRIGLVLAKLLGLLLNKPDTSKESMDLVVQGIVNELDIDLQVLLGLDDASAVRLLRENHGFSIAHMRELANLFYEMWVRTNGSDADSLRKKALALYEYVQANAQGTYYMDVMYRIKELK